MGLGFAKIRVLFCGPNKDYSILASIFGKLPYF